MTVLWAILACVAGLIAGVLLTRHRVTGPSAPVVGDSEGAKEISALQLCAERLQGALDAMPSGVIIADADGHVVVRNKAAANPRDDVNNEVLVQAAVQHHLRAALRG